MKNGVLFWISRFHPDDLQEFANQSFSKLLTSLHQLTEEEIKQCKISYTYRIKRKDGAWIQVLQNSFILEMDEARNPLLLFVIAFDITPYKKDNTVTLNITHYDYKNDIMKYITRHFNNCKNTSERENEIIRHITNGATAKQIANKMCLSVYTIQAHKRNIFTKTKTTNIAELTNYAFANGII